jgi:hypothetical protein
MEIDMRRHSSGHVEVDISRAWERRERERENIKISAKENLGYFEFMLRIISTKETSQIVVVTESK